MDKKKCIGVILQINKQTKNRMEKIKWNKKKLLTITNELILNLNEEMGILPHI